MVSDRSSSIPWHFSRREMLWYEVTCLLWREHDNSCETPWYRHSFLLLREEEWISSGMTWGFWRSCRLMVAAWLSKNRGTNDSGMGLLYSKTSWERACALTAEGCNDNTDQRCCEIPFLSWIGEHGALEEVFPGLKGDMKIVDDMLQSLWALVRRLKSWSDDEDVLTIKIRFWNGVGTTII